MKKIFNLFFFILITFNIYSKEKEIKTNYFRIVYDNNLSEYANELASVADGIAIKEFEFYRLPVPHDYKIDVIIADSKIENAFATPLFPIIYLYPNTPRSKIIEKNYSSWIKFVFTHELSHAILNIKIGGMPFFGKITKAIPFWLHEGLAVYMESKISDGGRKYSNRFNTFIKLELLEGNFKGLSLAGNNQVGKGNAYAYTYGFSFIDFYARKYGENKLRDAIDNLINPKNAYSTYLTIFANTINETTAQLIEEWKLWLNKNIKIPTNLKEGKSLNLPKGLKTHLINKGNKLYFYNNFNKELRIYEYSIETNEYKYLRKVNSPFYNFDVLDGKIYHCTIATNYFKGFNTFMPYIETFAYEDNSYLNTLESPINILKIDKDRLIYVSLLNGKQALKFGNNEVIIPFKDGYSFGKLFYFENKLFFDASKNNQKNSYIYEYDFSTKEIKRIAKGEEPFVDKKNIYYVKDAAGINNIFRINRSTLEIEQITNVKVSASDPVFIDNKLYYLNAISSENHELKRLDKKEFLGKRLGKESLKVTTYKIKPNILFEEENYRRKFDFIFFPLFISYSEKNAFYTEANLNISVYDDLRKNVVILSGGLKTKIKGEESSNKYFKWHPNFSLTYNYLHLFSAKINYGKTKINLLDTYTSEEISEDEWSASLNLNLPIYLPSISSYLNSSMIFDFTLNGSIYITLFEAFQRENFSFGFAMYPKLVDIYNKRSFDFRLEPFFSSKYIEIFYRFSPYDYSISTLINHSQNKNLNFPDGKTFILVPKFDYEIEILKGTEGGLIGLKSVILNLRSYIPLSYHEDIAENIVGLYNFVLNPEIKINTFMCYYLPISLIGGLNLPIYKSDKYNQDQDGRFKLGNEVVKDSIFYIGFGFHTN